MNRRTSNRVRFFNPYRDRVRKPRRIPRIASGGYNLGDLASAYTPGLTVSGDIVVRRTRRLPIKGEVLVRDGQPVEPEDVVARALLPGALQTLKLAEKMGLEPKDAIPMFRLRIGDSIEKGQVVAESKGLFGMFKSTAISDHAGVVESVSDVTGNVLIREPSIPVDVRAYILGKIAEVLPNEGAVVEARGAMVQGIFGIGGERTGRVRMAVSGPDKILEAGDIRDTDRGAIVIGGSGVTYEAIQKAVQVGATGLIAGGVRDRDLTQFLGYDIGVAITGEEAISLTLLVTEGFGYLAMADRTFELLKSLEGKTGSINGATQIRAGVIRPELIVPMPDIADGQVAATPNFELREGATIRVIREPYFGSLGTVTQLPPQLVTLESGAEVRVLMAKLTDGREVTVPRANVEIMAVV